MAISIRTFSDSDLERADIILQTAFQRPGSWLGELRLMRALQPTGAFLAHYREAPAGVVFSLMYPDFTYIGPLGVSPDFQRLGVGFALMENLLDWLDQQGVMRVALDASPTGQPIYEKMGFIACDQVNIFQRQRSGLTFQLSDGIQRLTHQNLDLITVTDKKTFGTDRSRLLHALLEVYPQRSFFLEDKQGYFIAQENRIGPWVSQTKGAAELLIQAALSLPFDNDPISVIVPGENSEAEVLLLQHGFERVRVLRHMVRGSTRPAGQRKNVYAQTNPSLG